MWEIRYTFGIMTFLMATNPWLDMQQWRWGGGELIDAWTGDWGNFHCHSE